MTLFSSARAMAGHNCDSRRIDTHQPHRYLGAGWHDAVPATVSESTVECGNTVARVTAVLWVSLRPTPDYDDIQGI